MKKLNVKVTPSTLTLSCVCRCDGLPVSCKWQSCISELMTLCNLRLCLQAGGERWACLSPRLAQSTPAVSCLDICSTTRLVLTLFLASDAGALISCRIHSTNQDLSAPRPFAVLFLSRFKHVVTSFTESLEFQHWTFLLIDTKETKPNQYNNSVLFKALQVLH